jgi:hypothetical protein
MRSPKQLEAPRLNGAKSRGPVTAAGKLTSSQNAIRHGILSGAVVLKTENPRAFQDIIEDFYALYEPANEFERSLVETMALARFRYSRIVNIEHRTMDLQIGREVAKGIAASLDPGDASAVLTALAFASLANETRTLDLLHRYETRLDRQFLRAQKRLIEMQDRRSSEEAIEEEVIKEDEDNDNDNQNPAPSNPGIIPIDFAKQTQADAPETDTEPQDEPQPAATLQPADSTTPTTPIASAENSNIEIAKRTQQPFENKPRPLGFPPQHRTQTRLTPVMPGNIVTKRLFRTRRITCGQFPFAAGSLIQK